MFLLSCFRKLFLFFFSFFFISTSHLHHFLLFTAFLNRGELFTECAYATKTAPTAVCALTNMLYLLGVLCSLFSGIICTNSNIDKYSLALSVYATSARRTLRHTGLPTLFALSKFYEGCPKGWIAGPDSCYRFLTNSNSLNAAASSCLSLGASLVAVETELENHFLSNVISLTAIRSSKPNLYP